MPCSPRSSLRTRSCYLYLGIALLLRRLWPSSPLLPSPCLGRILDSLQSCSHLTGLSPAARWPFQTNLSDSPPTQTAYHSNYWFPTPPWFRISITESLHRSLTSSSCSASPCPGCLQRHHRCCTLPAPTTGAMSSTWWSQIILMNSLNLIFFPIYINNSIIEN